jgi:formamidopyrimidine-DNA glycosylase
MTGHLFYKKRSEAEDKHDLVVFDFESLNGGGEKNGYHLRFNDYRRFGRLRLFSNEDLWAQPGLVDLGPEPLEITQQSFLDLFKNSRRMFKPALLDQTFIAGIGNIYADEALHMARLHPCRLTDSISRRKCLELRQHIQAILRKSISLMGTSVDSYSGVYGQSGSFQKYLLAYGNEGAPCKRCNRKIVRMKIGSRSAHYCPGCQRL